MNKMKKIVVSGEEIVNNPVLDVSTTLSESGYFLLTGIVYAPGKQPLPNAAVEIYRIDDVANPKNKELIGVTFTQDDGTYGISLPVGYSYSLKVYS